MLTYGAYSSLIAHSLSWQLSQWLENGHLLFSALAIHLETVDLLTPNFSAIWLMRQPHSKYKRRYSTVCSLTPSPPFQSAQIQASQTREQASFLSLPRKTPCPPQTHRRYAPSHKLREASMHFRRMGRSQHRRDL